MNRQLTATEVKAKLLALLNDVEAGEEIDITRHGVTVARLAPARGPHALKDRFVGIVTSVGDDEDLFSTGVRWDLQ
jgi:prevent-host-death family protein